MGLEILDVGDGACTVVRCLWSGCSSISVVDCGERRAPSSRPAGKLLAHLGSDLSRVDTLVVTHFDADHWEGLRDLAPQWSRVHRTPRPAVRILYPGLPPSAARLPAGVLALISTASGSTGVRALDLVRAWASVTSVNQLPLREGDRFDMGCDEWQVVWPPRRLPDPLFAAISRALKELSDLARRLDEAGHGTLLENLEIAYREGVGFDPDVEQEGLPDAVRDDELRGAVVEELEQEDENADAVHTVIRDDDGAGVVFPPPFDEEARRIARRLAKLNNLLSLVFHNVDDRYQPRTLVCGDVEGAPLRYLVNRLELRSRYDVILAPHHGSHSLPAGFPSARVCVAQAGVGHSANWWKHLDTHHDSHCCSTHHAGGVICVL